MWESESFPVTEVDIWLKSGHLNRFKVSSVFLACLLLRLPLLSEHRISPSALKKSGIVCMYLIATRP